MYRIIISDDKKSIRYTYDGVESIVSIDSIRESDSWKRLGIITIETPNPYDPNLVNRNSLTRSAFTSRFLHNEFDTIEKDPFHQYDKDIYKLYCLLDGKELDVDAAATNLLTQRKAIDESMRAWKNDKVAREVDATVSARNTMAEVSDRISVLEDITAADLEIEDGQEQVRELLDSVKEDIANDVQRLQADIAKNIEVAQKAKREVKPFLQSTEMLKLIALAEDESVPHITLENAKLADIESKALDLQKVSKDSQ